MKLRELFINWRNLPTMIAFRILQRAIQRDSGYAQIWQNNIVMAIHDEQSGKQIDLEFANRAASRFMQNCFDIE